MTELGMLGAMMPSNGLPSPLGAKMYWPVYAEADRLGCCLAVHGGAHDRFGMDHMNMYVPVHALGHPWGLTINCADIVYNGTSTVFRASASPSWKVGLPGCCCCSSVCMRPTTSLPVHSAG